MNIELLKENKLLHDTVERLEKTVNEYKDKINELNQMLFQVTSYNESDYVNKS